MASTRELLRFLLRKGYRQKRQSGSHLILVHPTRRMLVVPVHKGDIPRGLFLQILEDAGFTEKGFFKS